MTNPKKNRECHRCLEALGKCIVKYRMEGRRLKYYKEASKAEAKTATKTGKDGGVDLDQCSGL